MSVLAGTAPAQWLKRLPKDWASTVGEGALRERSELESARARDLKLVQSSLAGDRQAFRELVEHYQSRAFALALGIVKNRQDAEDIVQESFVKAYLSLKNFKGESAFYTWLYRIVTNMSIDFKRRVARNGGTASEYDESQSNPAPNLNATEEGVVQPQEALLRKERAQQIHQALAELSPEHRAVIVLREVDGLSYEEIADVVGVSKGTVMSRLHYARKKMQQVLGDLWSSQDQEGEVKQPDGLGLAARG